MSAWLGCAASATQAPAAEPTYDLTAGAETEVRPAPGCCSYEAQPLSLTEANAHGPALSTRLGLSMQCQVTHADGSTEQVELRFEHLDAATQMESRATDDSCPCAPRLQLQATVNIRATDPRLQRSTSTQLVEFAPGDGFNFDIADGDSHLQGVFGGPSPGFSLFAGSDGDGEVLARSATPCVMRGATAP